MISKILQIICCFSGPCCAPGTKAIFVKMRERKREELHQHVPGTNYMLGTRPKHLQSPCLICLTTYQVGAVRGGHGGSEWQNPLLRLSCPTPKPKSFCTLNLPGKREEVMQPPLGKLHLILSILWGTHNTRAFSCEF